MFLKTGAILFVQVFRVESVTNFIGHCGTTRANFWPSGAKSYDMNIKEQNNMEMRCALGEISGKVGFCQFPGPNLKLALAPIFKAVGGFSCNLQQQLSNIKITSQKGTRVRQPADGQPAVGPPATRDAQPTTVMALAASVLIAKETRNTGWKGLMICDE